MRKYERYMSTGKPWHIIEYIDGYNGSYKEGYWAFEHGYVQIYAEKDLTSFKFIWKGKLYMQTLSEFEGGLMEDRQLIIRAGKFARKIASTI